MAMRLVLTITACAASAALWSCAPRKAIIVEAAPVTPKTEAPLAANVPAEPGDLPPPDDGIRLPDMLGMPAESEFKTSSHGTKPSEGGAVVARPPTDPPSRPKPKPPESKDQEKEE